MSLALTRAGADTSRLYPRDLCSTLSLSAEEKAALKVGAGPSVDLSLRVVT
jgi:hypothetical protein